MVYRDVLEQLWLLDPVQAWLPFGREFTRMGAAPKHFLADPALACTLLGLSERDLLRVTARHSWDRRRAQCSGTSFASAAVSPEESQPARCVQFCR